MHVSGNHTAYFLLSFLSLLLLGACGTPAQRASAEDLEAPASSMSHSTQSVSGPYTTATPISEVINDPAFEDYGRLIFPTNTGYYSGNTLGELRLTWYSNIDPAKTVEIANYMRTRAEGRGNVRKLPLPYYL